MTSRTRRLLAAGKRIAQRRDPNIRDELATAAVRLGGDGERIRALPRAEINDALEDLGADRHLLAAVGSWGDTLSDDQVLAALRRLNRGEPPFDHIIASTGGK